MIQFHEKNRDIPLFRGDEIYYNKEKYSLFPSPFYKRDIYCKWYFLFLILFIKDANYFKLKLKKKKKK